MIVVLLALVEAFLEAEAQDLRVEVSLEEVAQDQAEDVLAN